MVDNPEFWLRVAAEFGPFAGMVGIMWYHITTQLKDLKNQVNTNQKSIAAIWNNLRGD